MLAGETSIVPKKVLIYMENLKVCDNAHSIRVQCPGLVQATEGWVEMH